MITAQLTLHDNIMITALDGKSKTDPALLIWDISDPINPKQIGQWKGGEGGSHRNSYPGGKYAYLPTYMPGYKGHVMVILDISDPAHPVVAGQWAQPGQKDGEPGLGAGSWISRPGQYRAPELQDGLRWDPRLTSSISTSPTWRIPS